MSFATRGEGARCAPMAVASLGLDALNGPHCPRVGADGSVRCGSPNVFHVPTATAAINTAMMAYSIVVGALPSSACGTCLTEFGDLSGGDMAAFPSCLGQPRGWRSVVDARIRSVVGGVAWKESSARVGVALVGALARRPRHERARAVPEASIRVFRLAPLDPATS